MKNTLMLLTLDEMLCKVPKKQKGMGYGRNLFCRIQQLCGTNLQEIRRKKPNCKNNVMRHFTVGHIFC